MVCWTCGQKGHKSKQCPSKQLGLSRLSKTNIIAGVDMSVMLANLYSNIERWDTITFEEEKEEEEENRDGEKGQQQNRCEMTEKEREGTIKSAASPPAATIAELEKHKGSLSDDDDDDDASDTDTDG